MLLACAGYPAGDRYYTAPFPSIITDSPDCHHSLLPLISWNHCFSFHWHYSSLFVLFKAIATVVLVPLVLQQRYHQLQWVQSAERSHRLSWMMTEQVTRDVRVWWLAWLRGYSMSGEQMVSFRSHMAKSSPRITRICDSMAPRRWSPPKAGRCHMSGFASPCKLPCGGSNGMEGWRSNWYGSQHTRNQPAFCHQKCQVNNHHPLGPTTKHCWATHHNVEKEERQIWKKEYSFVGSHIRSMILSRVLLPPSLTSSAPCSFVAMSEHLGLPTAPKTYP